MTIAVGFTLDNAASRNLSCPRSLTLLVLTVAGLIAGLGARWVGRADWASWLILAGTVPALVAVLSDSVASLIRREVGLDIIALLSIGGAITLREYVAAGVIGVMLSGGYGELKEKLIRLGHMGPASRSLYPLVAVSALGRSLADLGVSVDVGAGALAVMDVLAQAPDAVLAGSAP